MSYRFKTCKINYMHEPNSDSEVSAKWTENYTLDGVGDWPPSISPNDWPPSISPNDWPPSAQPGDWPPSIPMPEKHNIGYFGTGWICPKCGTPVSLMRDVCPICIGTCSCNKLTVTTTGTGEFNLDLSPSSFCKK